MYYNVYNSFIVIAHYIADNMVIANISFVISIHMHIILYLKFLFISVE